MVKISLYSADGKSDPVPCVIVELDADGFQNAERNLSAAAVRNRIDIGRAGIEPIAKTAWTLANLKAAQDQIAKAIERASATDAELEGRAARIESIRSVQIVDEIHATE